MLSFVPTEFAFPPVIVDELCTLLYNASLPVDTWSHLFLFTQEYSSSNSLLSLLQHHFSPPHWPFSIANKYAVISPILKSLDPASHSGEPSYFSALVYSKTQKDCLPFLCLMPLLPFSLKLTSVRPSRFHQVTEIALVKVIAKCSRQFSILILLGQWAAFVAVGHFLLLETLPSLGFPTAHSHGFPLTSVATFQHPLLFLPQYPSSWEHPKCSSWASFLLWLFHSLADLINSWF